MHTLWPYVNENGTLNPSVLGPGMHLTRTEYEQLYCAISKPIMRLATVMIWYTGIRQGELKRIRVSDVEFGNNRVVIRDRVGTRIIPLHPVLKRDLERYLSHLQISKGSDDLLPLNPHDYNQYLQRTSNRIGLQKNVTAPILRHSFIVNLVMLDTPHSIIENILGLGRRTPADELRAPLEYAKSIEQAIRSL